MNVVALFARPDLLPLLAMGPLVWMLTWGLDRRRSRRLAAAVGARAAKEIVDLSPPRRALKRLLFASGVFLCALASAQPRLGQGSRRIERRGVDIVVCLDVSRSMLAGDVAPSRLARARREIRALAEAATGDRFALVIFAGESRLAVPLTRDAGAFAEIADQADPLSVGRGGTDLGAALDTALAALAGRTGRHEVVLLLSDGDDHEGRGLAMARRCRERGITVHCVGFGSPRGAKIPVPGSGFLLDRQGRDVVTALNDAGLRAIADSAGGTYAAASEDAPAIPPLYEAEILTMERRLLDAEERKERKNRFQWPLLAALLLFMLDFSLCERRR